MKNRFYLSVLFCGLCLGFVGCETGEQYAQAPAFDMMESSSQAHAMASPVSLKREKTEVKKVAERSGVIGTGYGNYEWTSSNRNQVKFRRLNANKPDGLLVLAYRDESKIKTFGMTRVGELKDSSGTIKVRLVKDGFWKSSLPVYASISKHPSPLVLAPKDEQYSIEITNTLSDAVEVVVSIDGLNTTTGKPASFSGRGYVVGPEETVSVRGWTSGNGIRRFKFTYTDASVAANKPGAGNIQDIGTIGFAVFKSKTAEEAGTRGRPFAEMR